MHCFKWRQRCIFGTHFSLPYRFSKEWQNIFRSWWARFTSSLEIDLLQSNSQALTNKHQMFHRTNSEYTNVQCFHSSAFNDLNDLDILRASLPISDGNVNWDIPSSIWTNWFSLIVPVSSHTRKVCFAIPKKRKFYTVYST